MREACRDIVGGLGAGLRIVVAARHLKCRIRSFASILPCRPLCTTQAFPGPTEAVCLSPSARDLQIMGTPAATPASWLRPIYDAMFRKSGRA
jgi:hypothetical protein